MKHLKPVSIMLCAIMLLSSLITFAVSAAGFDYKLYDPALDSQKYPVEIVPGSVYGQRVIVNAPFDGVSFCLPTWNGTDSQCTLGVFKWTTDFDTTIKNGPVQELRLSSMRDCATNKLTLSKAQPAGEYFFAVYDTVNKVGIWRYPMTKSLGYAYMDGTETQHDLEITVSFTENTSDPVSACKSIFEDIDGTHKAPAEYVIPDNDILNVRAAKADTWTAIDGLGRVLPTNKDTGNVREDKYVGLFYWSWHNDLANNEALNVNDFIEKYPEAIHDYNYSKWPGASTAYFWNEPIYGYYRTVDRWVIRRQAELFAAAGVDVIFFDNTNGTFTWKSSYSVIFDVFEQARKDGVMTPQISFLLPFNGGGSDIKNQLETIYLDVYRPGKYQDLWFYWDGKPLLMGSNLSLDSSNLDKEIKKFFTFRAGQPAYEGSDQTTKQWGWLSRYPQDRYYAAGKDIKSGNVEQISVGVAQNSSTTILCTAMNGDNIYGRSYTHKDGFKHYSEPNHSLYGYNFAEQWEYALQVDPKFVFVTGWNEWTAGRHEEWGGVKNAFPDEFNDEYSRDIEPSKGALKDHYYYQLVYYIRKFKGTSAAEKPTAEKTIDVSGSPSQWDNVGPYYVAYPGNTGDRNANGYGKLVYTDKSGNNDIKGAKLARDSENLYVMIECDKNISSYTDKNWMLVYFDVTDNGLDGWESFDYVINKTAATKNKVTLEKFTGDGYNTAKVGECDYTVQGKYMQIKIPRKLMGLNGTEFTVNFKVTDGVALDNDIMNFYTSGDVAPAGRFRYSYTATGSAATDAPAETTAAETTTVPAEQTTEAESTADNDETVATVTDGTAEATDTTVSDIAESSDTAVDPQNGGDGETQTDAATTVTENPGETTTDSGDETDGKSSSPLPWIITGAAVVVGAAAAAIVILIKKKKK